METWKHLWKIKSVGGLGFWEISCFNQALLGKQDWRLLEFPNSLIARMLKARYFQDSNFMEAQMGSYPSYTWRSLVWGIELLHHCSRWCIGNGQAIRVYNDAWIPKERFFRVHSQPTLPLNSLVNSLISEGGCWDVEKVYNHFEWQKARAIFSIPLLRDRNDCRIWHFTPNGSYSVKSGYWVAHEYRELIDGISPSDILSPHPISYGNKSRK